MSNICKVSINMEYLWIMEVFFGYIILCRPNDDTTPTYSPGVNTGFLHRNRIDEVVSLWVHNDDRIIS